MDLSGIIDESQVRAWGDLLHVFDGAMAQWLVTLLVLDFVTGVFLAFQKNEFDWRESMRIAQKAVFVVVAWGAAAIISDNFGRAVYALAASSVVGSAVGNISALMGLDVRGLLGQLTTRGPGDGGDTIATRPGDGNT